MNVLDLCAGKGGLSAAFRDRGHDVRTLDFDPQFGCTYTMDVREFAKDPRAVLGDWTPDVILDGTPCEAFSVASIGHHWTGGARAYIPKTDGARLGLELVAAGLEAIAKLKPRVWVIENPRGVLRKLPVMEGLRRVTVWYCRYGDHRAKPTDLWGGFPETWAPRAPCWNGNDDHEAAPRGAKTGTQGLKGAPARALAPYALGLDLCIAAEGGSAPGRSLASFEVAA